MNRERAIVKASKRLSWLLRHGANEAGLAMDEAGWVTCNEVLRVTKMSRDELEDAVRYNTKSRLQLDNDRIRACQGHSLSGMPVTREALEASWNRFEGGPSLFHGTNVEAAESIATKGLLPGGRTHVHLAASTDSPVGKRYNTPVLLEVSVELLRASGREIFVSQNGVVLVLDVPRSCIVGLTTHSHKARQNEQRLNELFGL